MKKNYLSYPYSRGRWKKTVLIMKLTVFLLLFSVIQVSAISVYSQQEKVSIKAENKRISEVFDMLQKQTSLIFVYKDSDVEDVNRINLETQEQTITDVLYEVLKSTNLSFAILEDMVVIRPKENVVQQQKSISGKVTDTNGDPIPGANVILEGYNTGTITDTNGEFTMNVPEENGVLRISFVGFKIEKVLFTVGKKVKVMMSEDVEGIDEVKVIAYGTTTRREMTGSVATVKGAELEDVPTANLANALQGRVAGMDVSNITGAPGGGGTQITIRGYNSLNVEAERRFSEPLWVVDGVPLSSFTSPITGTNLLSDLNPDMIESIEVLKDASSTSLYGSRAANGVIMVTTKRGKKNQKATFSANVSYTYSFLPELPTVTLGKGERDYRLWATTNNNTPYYREGYGTYNYAQSYWDAYKNRSNGEQFYNNWYDTRVYNASYIPTKGGSSTFQDSLNTFYNNATNFFPMYYDMGEVINANLQCYGGTEQVTYGLGIGFYDEEGILRGTGYNRADLNANFNIKPLKRLMIDLRVNMSLSERNRSSDSRKGGSGTDIEVVPGEPYELSTLF
ncbi:MAG: TonB-dependent receptor plug domain-containing protein, partial [Bacteroidales bacterium]|nr:TonB-dependent receptor plug domain-containing protein [Bacteroidales bacterium]